MNSYIIPITLFIKDFFIFISAVSIVASIVLCVKFVKGHIDLKACFIAQLTVYNIVLFVNWISFETSYKVTADCVLMLRFLPVFTLMIIANCRVTSMKNLFMSSTVKNVFYSILNTLLVLAFIVYVNSFQTEYTTFFNKCSNGDYLIALRFITHLVCSRYTSFRDWQVTMLVVTLISLVASCGISIYTTFKENQHAWYKISSIVMLVVPIVYLVAFKVMPSHLDDMTLSFKADLVFLLFVFILSEVIRLVDTILACFELNPFQENKKIVLKTVKKALKMDKLDKSTITRLKYCGRIMQNYPKIKEHVPLKKTAGQIAELLGLTDERWTNS